MDTDFESCWPELFAPLSQAQRAELAKRAEHGELRVKPGTDCHSIEASAEAPRLLAEDDFDGVALKSRMIDPRDGVTEVDFPEYRVYFSDLYGATEEWQLTESRSVLEVVEWADAKAGRRSYLLYAEWPLSAGVGLVRLLERNSQ